MVPAVLVHLAQSGREAPGAEGLMVEIAPPRRQRGVGAERVRLGHVRLAEVPVQVPHVLAPPHDLSDEALDARKRGSPRAIGVFGGLDDFQRVQQAEVEWH